eukprot:1189034-Prorocentrum_minimum.AAC.6
MPCAEWFTSVDSRRLPTVELKSMAFLAVDSGARQNPVLSNNGTVYVRAHAREYSMLAANRMTMTENIPCGQPI